MRVMNEVILGINEMRVVLLIDAQATIGRYEPIKISGYWCLRYRHFLSVCSVFGFVIN